MSPPPVEGLAPVAGSRRRGPLSVVVAWALSGTFAGTAVGATLHLLDRVGGVATIALTAGALSALAGAGLWCVAGRRSTARRGPCLLGVPLVVGVLALGSLAMVGTVHTGSRAVGFGFLVLAVAASGLFVPLGTSWALGRALHAEQQGDPETAARIWERLAGLGFLSERVRAEAALNLGSLALRYGDLTTAARWYAVPERGRGAAYGAAGRALVRVLEGRYDEAERLLVRAAAGGRSATLEADGVRLLLVFRREGPGAALELAGRLSGGPTGLLFRGVHAAARRAAGGRDPIDPELGDALQASPLSGIIPELRDL